MSRVSLIEQLYTPRKKSALEFNYDNLWAPPIRFFLTQEDIDKLYKIATSLKYNDDIDEKYKLIDAVMRPRGFKRGNCGTNRVVYNFLEDTSFCMKIAVDRVGISDSPREFKNQEFFKPFCCKIFEVDPTGVIACVERVNPISSLEEFTSIADDVFNMMITKIIGKYVVDDLGTEKYLNYGMRYNSNGCAFGPVVLDFPYAYELDGAKLRCCKPVRIGNREYACGGEIDYDAGLNNLVCCKCGRHYSARELAKDDSCVLKFYSDNDQGRVRARIVRQSDGTIIKDSGRSSKLYMTKEEYEEGIRMFELDSLEPRRVSKTIKNKYTPLKQLRANYYNELQVKAYEEMQKRNAEPFNPVIEPEFGPRNATRAKKNKTENVEYTMPVNTPAVYEYPKTRVALRAENLASNTITIENAYENITGQVAPAEAHPLDLMANIIEVADNAISQEESNNSEEEYDLNHDLAVAINEIITDDNAESDTEEEPIESLIDEMEADVFPELSNVENSINHEDMDYDYYDKLFDRKKNKRNKNNKTKHNKKYLYDDMDEY